MSNAKHLKELIKKITGGRDYFTKEDYKLCAMTIFGYESTNLELELIYGNGNESLHFSEISNIFKQKLSFMDTGRDDCMEFNNWFQQVDRSCII